jgi:hypothetical protein
MKNLKSTTLLATSLVASLFISQAAMAGPEGTLVEYSGHPHAPEVSSESVTPMHSLQMKRENYLLDKKAEQEKLYEELFPEPEA